MKQITVRRGVIKINKTYTSRIYVDKHFYCFGGIEKESIAKQLRIELKSNFKSLTLEGFQIWFLSKTLELKRNKTIKEFNLFKNEQSDSGLRRNNNTSAYLKDNFYIVRLMKNGQSYCFPSLHSEILANDLKAKAVNIANTKPLKEFQEWFLNTTLSLVKESTIDKLNLFKEKI